MKSSSKQRSGGRPGVLIPAGTGSDRSSEWLGRVFAAAIIAMIAVLSLQRIWSVDYWWQWKTGEWVLRHGAPRRDLFSFTNPEHARIEVRWLYCGALYALTHALGHGAATLVKCAVVLGTFWLAVRLGTRRWWHPAAWAVVGVAALACSQRLVVRPETASYAFLLLTVAIIVRLQAGRSRWAFALPALVALWANVHGLFVLGPAVVGAWLVSEAIEARFARRRGGGDPDRIRRLRTAAVLSFATLVSPLANPYGPRIWALVVDQYRTLQDPAQRSFYAELASPFSFSQRFTAVVFYEVLIGMVVLAAVAAGRRVRVFWAILVASQLWLSATAIRNLPLFALVAIPFVLRGFHDSPWRARLRIGRARRPAGVLAALAGIAAALFVVRDVATDRFAVRQHDTNQFGLGIASQRFPEGAAAFLRAHKFEGPLFNTPAAGSYLLAHGFKVFIDPRGEVYQDGLLAEYRRLVEKPAAAKVSEYTERWGLRAMVLDPDMFALAREAERAEWRVVFADAESIVLLHRDASLDIPRLDPGKIGDAWVPLPGDPAARRRLPPARAYVGVGPLTRVTNPAPYARLGRLAWELGAQQQSCAFYGIAYAAYPPNFRDWAALGWCASRAGDRRRAARSYARAVAQDPRNEQYLEHAAVACLAIDSLAAARAFAETLRVVAEDDSPALQVLATAMLKERRADDAAAILQGAIKLAASATGEQASHSYFLLGQARALQGRWQDAAHAFEQAIERDSTSVHAAQWMGRVLERLGDGPKASVWYARAAKLEARQRADSLGAQ